MAVPIGFVRKVLVEIAAQTNLSISVLTGKVTWAQLGLSPDIFRRLAMDLAIVARQWATVVPPPVVTPDSLGKAKNLALAVAFLVAATFGVVITEDQATGLINIAKTQPVTAEAVFLESSARRTQSKVRRKKPKAGELSSSRTRAKRKPR